MHMYTHRHIHLVCLHVQVYVCVYTVIFQIYLSAIVIELIVLIDKSEFQGPFYHFLKQQIRKKMFLPHSQKGQ